MIDYDVRVKRDKGLRPIAEPIWFEPREEILISEIISEIVSEDNLNLMAYNICGDHIHLLFVCEESKVTKIMQKIKAKTSRAINIKRGITVATTREHAPLSDSNEYTSLPRGIKQNSLWTQKYGCKEIYDENQLANTVEYIRNNRIKHGLADKKGLQPLVDSMCCSYEHAFRSEYSGGFDVVIGNPPYGVSFQENEKTYLSKYDKLVPDYEIYIYFISLYQKILKDFGCLSYIFPNTFLSTLFGINYRENIISNVNINTIVDLSQDNTFVDASVRTIILTFTKEKVYNYQTLLIKLIEGEFSNFDSYSKNEILKEKYNLLNLFNQSRDEKKIINKLSNEPKLESYFRVSQGLIPYDKYRGHDEYTIKNRIWHANNRVNETYKKELKGGDVTRYS